MSCSCCRSTISRSRPVIRTATLHVSLVAVFSLLANLVLALFLDMHAIRHLLQELSLEFHAIKESIFRPVEDVPVIFLLVSLLISALFIFAAGPGCSSSGSSRCPPHELTATIANHIDLHLLADLFHDTGEETTNIDISTFESDVATACFSRSMELANCINTLSAEDNDTALEDVGAIASAPSLMEHHAASVQEEALGDQSCKDSQVQINECEVSEHRLAVVAAQTTGPSSAVQLLGAAVEAAAPPAAEMSVDHAPMRRRMNILSSGRRYVIGEYGRHLAALAYYNYEVAARLHMDMVPSRYASSLVDSLSREDANKHFSDFRTRIWAKIRGESPARHHPSSSALISV